MASEPVRGRIFQLLGEFLDYPQAGLAEAIQECEALASLYNPEAATLLHDFRAFVEKTPLKRLEEIYTGTFDLDAACYPYVGYHLFGESYKRSVFLLGLQERYRAQNYVSETELADHMGVMLRFLAVNNDMDMEKELISEALLPALDKMTKEKEAAPPEDGEEEPKPRRARKADLQNRPYHGILQALGLVLSAGAPAPSSLGQANAPALSQPVKSHESPQVRAESHGAPNEAAESRVTG